MFRRVIFPLICVLHVATVQAQTTEEMDALGKRADQLQQSGQYSDALPIIEELSEAVRQNFGDNSGENAAITARRAGLLQALGRYQEAEAFYKRALQIATEALGPEHAGVTFVLNDLALLYKIQGRFKDAEPVYRKALAIREKDLGPNHPAVAHINSNLGALYYAQGRYSEAEPLFTNAIAVLEKVLKADHPEVGKNLNNLAALNWSLGRFTDAEPLYKRALAIVENSLGSEHPAVSSALNNLALLYQDQGRYADAEPLLQRALALREKALGSEHPDVGESANNLAWFYQGRGRYTEAEPLYRRALKISEKALGSQHSTVGSMLNNLAVLYYDQGRYADAEPLFKRAVAVRQGALGAEHSDVGQTMYRLARLYQAEKRFTKARTLHERALQIRRKAQGPEHPEVIQSLDGIADMYEAQRNWKLAAAYARQARDVVISRSRRGAADGAGGESGRREIAQGREVFARLVRTLWEMGKRPSPRHAALLGESYLGALWGEQTEASAALAQMSVRQAKGTGSLADLVRERQDLTHQWQVLDKQLYTSIAQATGRNVEAERQVRDQLAIVASRRTAIDGSLKRDFSDFLALSNPEPISAQASRALLAPDEAIIQFMVSEDDVFVWAITRGGERWLRSSLGAKTLAERVAALRCGLDASLWDEPDRSDSARACAAALKVAPTVEVVSGWQEKILPFDLSRAHELYTALFAPFEDLIAGKQLLIVASGPLTSMPFHVLVTKRPTKPIPSRLADYRKVAWLAERHSITVLPSVVSLKVLRQYAKSSRAGKPYLGVGNPLLHGPKGNDNSAWERLSCKDAATRAQVANRGPRRGNMSKLFRGSLADVDEVRALIPLPETTDELCAVARSLGTDDSALFLGDRATETTIKALSGDGTLAAARVIHFATHGLLAGQTQAFASAKAEPALILTPPQTASEDDDGLLTASEIVQLKLDADWVVLSACNTAAAESDKPGAEALSGLARAFFYAGARALLVSHWSVNSEATVKLITKAFAELRSNRKIGRAEALRRSMLALRKSGGSYVHPANWAPFVVVGEGNR
jgi:CHAT domain-containing protein/tetratricopeptide (TPR) repeat protein